ncbi:MAG: GNAT family N-acetyltransferase [Ktedonobacteraceae bacterium]|nr:GNAT family N-acetyltransferase [Ktedonobacteraceae bacterium]
MASVEIFLHEERPIDPQEVLALYALFGWWPDRTTEEIAYVLNNDLAVGAWDEGQLVGFARVVSDHCFHTYIEDVMVHPTYQKISIGSLILSRLMEALPTTEIVTLFCQAELVPFYEKQGFRAFPSQVIMHRKGAMPTDLDESF